MTGTGPAGDGSLVLSACHGNDGNQFTEAARAVISVRSTTSASGTAQSAWTCEA